MDFTNVPGLLIDNTEPSAQFDAQSQLNKPKAATVIADQGSCAIVRSEQLSQSIAKQNNRQFDDSFDVRLEAERFLNDLATY